MRKLALVLLLVATPMLAEKPTSDPSSYTLSVQVNCSFVITESPGKLPSDPVHLGVTLGGKQLELVSDVFSFPLVPGNYKGRLLKDLSPNAYEIQQTYELLLPDGKTRSFHVTSVGRSVCGVPLS